MLFTPSDSEGEYQIGKQNMQADSFNSNIKELRQSSGCVHPLCRGFPLAVVPPVETAQFSSAKPCFSHVLLEVPPSPGVFAMVLLTFGFCVFSQLAPTGFVPPAAIVLTSAEPMGAGESGRELAEGRPVPVPALSFCRCSESLSVYFLPCLNIASAPRSSTNSLLLCVHFGLFLCAFAFLAGEPTKVRDLPLTSLWRCSDPGVGLLAFHEEEAVALCPGGTGGREWHDDC